MLGDISVLLIKVSCAIDEAIHVITADEKNDHIKATQK